MKTLFQPILSLSHLLHDAADLELRNNHIGGGHDLSRRLHEEANSFTVSVPVPGVSTGGLNVHLDGGVLAVFRKRQPISVEHPGTLKREDLMCSFVLPAGIDTDRIQAKCHNGLLTITLKKIKTKKNRTLIKVLGQENRSKDSGRLNTLWDKLKAKLDTRIIVPMRSNKYS